MPLNDYWLKSLPAFLEQRIEAALNQSVGAIADSNVRTQVLEDLRNIINLSGNERIEAIDKLLMRGVNNGDVSVALSYLIAQNRFASNPFLLIAKARLDTRNVIWKSGPGYDTLIQPLLSQALKLANESFNSPNSKNASPAINRADAAYINREAAWMFAQIGKDKDFQQRDWISRFYEMSAEERAGLTEGDVISIESPVPDPRNTPRPRTEAEKDLIKIKDEREKDKAFENDMDKGRRIAETNDPRSADRTEIHTETIETTETKGSSSPNQENKKDAYAKGQKQAKPSPGKIVRDYATPVSRGSIAATNVWSGALELLLRALNGKYSRCEWRQLRDILPKNIVWKW